MTLSAKEIVGMAVQPTLGTPVTTANEIFPVTSFSLQEMHEQILDNGRRGLESMDYRAVQGVEHVEISIDGVVQTQSGTTKGSPLGYLLRSILGTGSGTTQYPAPTQIPTTSGVYKHYRTLGTTKEYLTVQHYSGLAGNNARSIADCRVTSLTIAFNSGEGVVTYSANLVGNDVALVANTDLSALQTTLEDPFAGWQTGHIVVNTDAEGAADLISAEWSLSREPHRIHTAQNQQKYTDLLLGPLEVTCALVFDYVGNPNDQIALFRAKTQGELTTKFEIGTRGNAAFRGFGISSVLTDFGDGPAVVDSSGNSVTLALSARCLHSGSNGPMGVDNDAADTSSDARAQNGPIETLTEETTTANY